MNIASNNTFSNVVDGLLWFKLCSLVLYNVAIWCVQVTVVEITWPVRNTCSKVDMPLVIYARFSVFALRFLF